MKFYLLIYYYFIKFKYVNKNVNGIVLDIIIYKKKEGLC